MEKEEFFKKLEEQAKDVDIILSKEQQEKFYQYMQLLLQWNEKMNLTAITEPEEVIQKHFIDSITISKYLTPKDTLIDVGTGAGFPAIPLKIVHPEIEVTLLDSLNKRLTFLAEVIDKLQLTQMHTIHARAEEGGRDQQYREVFDVATSRAVAPLNILVEYLLPFVKKNGYCICMKGSNAKQEMEHAAKAIELLGGNIEKVEEFKLPNSQMERTIIVIKKVKPTAITYPRKPGIPAKEPIE